MTLQPISAYEKPSCWATLTWQLYIVNLLLEVKLQSLNSGKVERCVVLEFDATLCTDSFRQHLLFAQVASEQQQKGKPGQLVDPRPETVEGGEVKIRITPQLVHDIFDEYPVVAKAYNDNVPKKVHITVFRT
jgi:hypothetical protein